MGQGEKETWKNRKVGDGTPGPGRRKGVPNKNTTLLKEAILQAALEAGGRDGLIGYLRQQAIENPASFMALLGKVLPLQLVGEGEGPVHIILSREDEAL